MLNQAWGKAQGGQAFSWYKWAQLSGAAFTCPGEPMDFTGRRHRQILHFLKSSLLGKETVSHLRLVTSFCQDRKAVLTGEVLLDSQPPSSTLGTASHGHTTYTKFIGV